ncbi:MAG: rod shape-determining protein, partial [Fusobacteriaceae bacterium]
EETMIVKGRDMIMGLPKSVEIGSEEVREALKDSLMEIVNCIKLVLEKTPPELSSDIVDDGIVMTGGGSLIRHFTDLVSQSTNLKVRLAENPLESVVIGAGMALEQLDILRKIEKVER